MVNYKNRHVYINKFTIILTEKMNKNEKNKHHGNNTYYRR
jgi:hypothetical protein